MKKEALLLILGALLLFSNCGKNNERELVVKSRSRYTVAYEGDTLSIASVAGKSIGQTKPWRFIKRQGEYFDLSTGEVFFSTKRTLKQAREERSVTVYGTSNYSINYIGKLVDSPYRLRDYLHDIVNLDDNLYVNAHFVSLELGKDYIRLTMAYVYDENYDMKAIIQGGASAVYAEP